MGEKKERKMIAYALTQMAKTALVSTANSKCVFVFHQPKQPQELRQFRKF